MKKLSLKFKRTMVSAVVVIIAVGASAFTIESNKLAPGEFRFYNISGILNNQNPSNFIYQDNGSGLCDFNSDMECSAVWEVNLPMGVTTPSPGDRPNDFNSYSYKEDINLGDYNP